MKFSGTKHSGSRKVIRKFGLLEVVALETITDSLFFSMTDTSAGSQDIVLNFWQFVLLDQRYILCLEHNFLRLTDFLIYSSKL